MQRISDWHKHAAEQQDLTRRPQIIIFHAVLSAVR